MEKIRVLVVDDSLVIRRALRECFRADPEIEVVGVAHTGLSALEQIDALKPDLITLDIEMPEMDGLETLRTLRTQGSNIPIIMFSKYTSHGATATLEALELGASDVVAKPEAHGGKGASCDFAKRQLASRIRALGRKSKKKQKECPRPDIQRQPLAPLPPYRVTHPVDAVGIAISTGGPGALIEVVATLSPSLPVPIFLTQHMPPLFTKYLAERLTAKGALPAHEATEGMTVRPGNIYIAPGDFHLELARSGSDVVIHLSQTPPENSCRPSADVMFRSMATVYGSQVLALVMTGMGQDGRRGCEVIKAQGGTVVVQDEATSLVWGMPKAVAAAGLHNAMVPLSEVARLINHSCLKDKETR